MGCCVNNPSPPAELSWVCEGELSPSPCGASEGDLHLLDGSDGPKLDDGSGGGARLGDPLGLGEAANLGDPLLCGDGRAGTRNTSGWAGDCSVPCGETSLMPSRPGSEAAAIRGVPEREGVAEAER